MLICLASVIVSTWLYWSLRPDADTDGGSPHESLVAGDTLLVSRIREPGAALVSESRAAGDACDVVYRIQNVSTHESRLRVKGISCSCFNAFLDTDELRSGHEFALAPGASRVLRLRPSPRGASSSQHDVRVQLGLTNSRGAASEFAVTGMVRLLADVEVQPDTICHEFRTASKTVDQISITVRRHFRDVQHQAVEPTLRSLPPQVRLAGITKAGDVREVDAGLWQQEWRVLLDVECDERVSQHPSYTRFRIEFPPADEAAVEVPLVLRRRFGIYAPSSIHFGPVSPGERREKRLRIHAGDERSFSILDVSSTAEGISGRDALQRPATHHWLTVVADRTREPLGAGRLVIRTDHPDNRELSIAVSAAPGELPAGP